MTSSTCVDDNVVLLLLVLAAMSTDLVLAFFRARRAALEAQCQASDFADSIFERNMGHVDGMVAALKATRTDMPFAQASRLRLQCVNTAELVRDSIRSDEPV